MKKSIIVPALNEAAGIAEVVLRCRKVCQEGDEILVIDDGSSDNTSEIASRAGARVVKHEVNKGKASALRTGFENARNEIIVTIDADCTYPPEAIPEMMSALEQADLIVASRFRGRWPKYLPFHRVLANKLGALFTSLLLGAIVTDVTTGLRAFRKDILQKMPSIQARGLDFEAEFTSRAITAGLRYKEVKIDAEPRRGTSTLRFFRDIWTFFKAVLRGKFG